MRKKNSSVLAPMWFIFHSEIMLRVPETAHKYCFVL